MSDSSLSDYCRLCTISFQVEFGSKLGKQGQFSSENLFRPSKQKDCFGVVSAEICKEVGLPFVHFMQYSDRVCNPCGRKIHNLDQFYQFIKAAITSTPLPRLRAANIHLARRTKPAQHGERKSKSVRVNSRAAKSPSIEGSKSATKGK